VEFEEEKFNDESATIMDFSLAASNHQQAVFHYILPFSKKYALIETTLFTLASFNEEKYDEIWLDYMQTNFPDQSYKIISTEKGSIPMRITQQENHSNRIFLIGGDNGFTKASTGYAFARMHANAQNLVHRKIPKKHQARFRFYDSMLLSIIHHEVEQIPSVMDRMFDQIPFRKILQFLDEKSNLKDEINIFSKLNILLFLKHLLKFYK
jgi:lycopene beta-cyclase